MQARFSTEPPVDKVSVSDDKKRTKTEARKGNQTVVNVSFFESEITLCFLKQHTVGTPAAGWKCRVWKSADLWLKTGSGLS